MGKGAQNMGVTQKAVVKRADGLFLTLRRSATAPSHAGKWDLPGGELEQGEDPRVGIAREVIEEAGIEITHVTPFDVFGHKNAVGFWITIAYTADALSDNVHLSYEHDDFKWVTKKEFLQLASTDKLRQFVSTLA